jgi:hypothetical protein
VVTRRIETMAASFISIRSTGPEIRGEISHSRPSLRLIEGGRSASAAAHRQRVFALRRVVVVAVLFVLTSAALMAGRSLVGGEGESMAAAASVPASYQVVAGESLWSIARDLAPNSDPRYIVAELAAANGGEIILAGSTLRIPESVREAANS